MDQALGFFRQSLGNVEVIVLQVLDKRIGHLLDGQDIIRQTGGNGVFGRPRVLGGFRVLNHGHAVRSLDGLEPVRAGSAGDRGSCSVDEAGVPIGRVGGPDCSAVLTGLSIFFSAIFGTSNPSIRATLDRQDCC